ncbi:TIGR03620 family F420-dependent LLM class oxidoreductase [Amycolatopsis vastitatis]|uniref:LLM class flavin-dependent oxidoreductase n=1 Tax=Amycolatopsis vastitatis TaxID=1905142 RepID=A0A229SYW9_9PSEU|nr:TIGR03620 family F420-dependent LLM class oxidoreductase [Amycolatopsis vastitatis]OXM64148.1 LLM class flavin-dependent oxidoreductase [Amycolatopsis vastitatis]
MGADEVVDVARRTLGPVGVCLPVSFTSTPPVEHQRAAVRQLERAGHRAAWTNEVIGKDAFAHLSVLLAATERMAFGTCVANIWARPPQTAHGAAAYFAQAFPDRFTLGLGVGYPQQAESVGRGFGRPLATMRDYVGGMDGETWPPAPDTAYPRILAANGPKMLGLAAEIADGALPARLPPEHTARARQLLGPDKLLVVGQSVVVDDDRDRARATARQVVAGWSGNAGFRDGLAELGYPAGDSDEVVDALVAHGGPDTIAAKVRAHLAAGADHVTLLLPIGTEFGPGIDQLTQVAPALADLT